MWSTREARAEVCAHPFRGDLRHKLEAGVGFSVWYSVSVGVLIPAQWAASFAVGGVSELQTEPVALALHLVAEALMAGALLVGAVGLLRRKTGGMGVALIGHGMLAYTVVASAGYFAELRALPMVALFAVLVALAAVSVARLLRGPGAPGERSARGIGRLSRP